VSGVSSTAGLIVDNFAGGGGASTGIEQALGRAGDIAINHDDEAIRMHEVNHPGTRHIRNNIWQIDPLEATGGAPVDLAWFSPDCKHFSKAKGGKPREKSIRDLAWVVVLWAQRARPAVILLENVEEFRTWGPLDEGGQPIKARAGETFDKWCRQLRKAGYRLQFRELRACDYGAPTIRKRFFMIARRDGRPIVWPEPTHGKPGSPEVLAGKRLPWRTAAEIIDWSLPCPSIFERKKPLAEKTLRRIAHGIMKFVVDNPRPFIVPLTHHQEGARGAVAAFLQPYYGEKADGRVRTGNPADEPLRTSTAENRFGVVAAHLAQFSETREGRKLNPGHSAEEPVSTIVRKGPLQAVVASNLVKLRGTCAHGQATDEPLHTVSAGGTHMAEVRAFLLKYYGTDQDPRLGEPLHSCTTKDRFGLVTVTIEGEEYVIVDIGMRMLTPRELFNAQGFPPDYIIDRDAEGRPITKTAQVAKCGNSVCPPIARALAGANVAGAAEQEAEAA
jgi:DNA (cytosine-5)-methyltransferase 1